MRIAAITSLAVLALFAGAAQAQVYCWTTKDGKRACGDTPPPGVKPAAVATPSTPAAPADSGAKAGKKPPADPEQDFRKRQAESQKSRDKEQQAQEQAETKRQNCESARTSLRALESGQRLARVDKDGERYYLEEQEVAAETQRARESVQKNCT